ncbi:ImmA/IrrE family metallo-endopeptidase [Flavobacterium sp. KACC 22763]|uniref:ImmA/IrrE family metallo-endopeptidase n=1 Tax=Flavobacterium sp. KACC 22763 TaxID=3025668 RepID=UPI002365F371|nr:ImmA/IrrE family metallo-endopeptidase [Flavobacterium sp. KACC 22763]WDF65528.1 ImmA/IrrE family metallo-endopeptidase [Flavobacterium sp. KACC 22763]
MIDDFTRKEIEKISHNILKESKSFDIFPTPVDKILSYSDFALDNKIDLQNIDDSFFDSFKEKLVDPSKKALMHALSKIKGFFYREEKTIYIDAELDKNLGKKNFVKLHEIGHGVLSWQNEIILALDNDETLSEEYDEQFEAEANYFASLTLFQHDRFLEECEKLSLGLGAVMAISKKFGASVHSSFRNYVLQSKNRCALLVLNHPVNKNGFVNTLTTRDLFYSKKFLEEFGELQLPDEFGFKWSFVQDFKFKKKFHENGVISLNTKEGEDLKASYHFFNNTYNSFVFFFPKGEKNRARTKIILQ